MILFGVLLMVRVIMEVIYDNASSTVINRNTDSSVRATTCHRGFIYRLCSSNGGRGKELFDVVWAGTDDCHGSIE